MEISLASDFADGRVGHATIAMRIVHGFCASRRQNSKPMRVTDQSQEQQS